MNLLITTKYNEECTLDWVEFLGVMHAISKVFLVFAKILGQNPKYCCKQITCLLNLITKFEKKNTSQIIRKNAIGTLSIN